MRTLLNLASLFIFLTGLIMGIFLGANIPKSDDLLITGYEKVKEMQHAKFVRDVEDYLREKGER
jgi:hypothetical protein